MEVIRRYAEELRAIGQALAAAKVTGFELYSVPAGYFVKDLREEAPASASIMWNWLRGQPKNKIDFVTYGFELRDVEELCERGRARRRNPGQVARVGDPSNILRTILACIDGKQAELLEVHKRPISVTLASRDRSRREYREDRTVSSFQTLFAELCARRTQNRG